MMLLLNLDINIKSNNHNNPLDIQLKKICKLRPSSRNQRGNSCKKSRNKAVEVDIFPKIGKN